MADFMPQDPTNVVIRELFHGMKLKAPAHRIPLGAGVDIKNLRVSSGGLLRADSWREKTVAFVPTADDVLIQADLVFTRQNILELMFFGEKFIYLLDTDGTTLVPITHGIVYDDELNPATLTWEAATTKLYWQLAVPAGTSLDRVNRGDLLTFGGISVNVGRIEGQNLIFTADLDIALSGTTYDSFTTLFAFGARSPYKFDYIAIPGNVLFVDRSNRGITGYNTDLGLREIDFAPVTDPTSINAIGYHDYRMWIGGFTDKNGVRFPNRILWGKRSSPLDPAFLQIEDSTYFLDLVGPKTEIMRIVSLGQLLVIYFGDAIFFGRPTNIIGLPYDFEMLNTGGLGLAGQRALASLADGHYFVGRDDIYFFSSQGSLEKIGSEVVKETIDIYKNSLDESLVVADPKHSRILFAFKPIGVTEFTELWAYDYEFKAWTYLDVAGTGLTQVSFVTARSWDSYIEGNNDVELTPSLEFQWDAPEFSDLVWEDLLPDGNLNQLLLIHNDKLFLPTQESAYCFARERVPEVVYESGDIDFDLPDQMKTATRLTLKLDVPRTLGADAVDVVDDSSLDFVVEVSKNRGQTWKPCGILSIGIGQDEGKINFLSTGSLFRFRIRTSSRVRPFLITEFGVRARKAGLETTYT